MDQVGNSHEHEGAEINALSICVHDNGSASVLLRDLLDPRFAIDMYFTRGTRPKLLYHTLYKFVNSRGSKSSHINVFTWVQRGWGFQEKTEDAILVAAKCDDAEIGFEASFMAGDEIQESIWTRETRCNGGERRAKRKLCTVRDNNQGIRFHIGAERRDECCDRRTNCMLARRTACAR